MADYRLLWADIKAPADILGELPIEQISLSHILNSPGSITGTLPLDPYGPASMKTVANIIYPSAWYDIGRETASADLFVMGEPTDAYDRSTARQLFGPSSFGTARTVVYVERDGVILKGGVLWGIEASVESGTLTFYAEGWLSYYRLRSIQGDLIFTATDQDAIARGILARTHLFGDIGVQLQTNLHGVTRDRTYQWWQNYNVAETLQRLAQVRDGFDFDFISTRDTAGDIETTFWTYYPANGRETDHVFELGTNIELVAYQEDGKAVVNQSRAFGSGLGTEVQTATLQDSASIQTYPLLERNTSHPTVLEQDTLTRHVQRTLDRGNGPTVNLSLQVHADAIPKIGSYQVGDRVKVTADYGYIQLDQADYRITSHEISVSTEGEISTVALAPLQLFV